MNPATIMITVYNACQAARQCLASVLRHTPLSPECRVLVMDDRGQEPELPAFFASLEGRPFVEVAHNPRNLGYTATINRGIRLCGGRDVLLLNSDTIVTPGWWQKMRRWAYAAENIGTVTPVSGNAGVFSVPETGENSLPPEIDIDAMAAIVEECGRDKFFTAPTGNGFCMYIRAEVIDRVGLFDEGLFSRGYGEENDFCMRAMMAGFENVVCLDTWIYHAAHASFGDSGRKLQARGLARLRALYPDYWGMTRIFYTSPEFQEVKKRIAARLEPFSPHGRVSGTAAGSLKKCLRVLREEGLRAIAGKIARRVARLARPNGKEAGAANADWPEAGDAELPEIDSLAEILSQRLEGAPAHVIIGANFGGESWRRAMALADDAVNQGAAAIHMAWNRGLRRVIAVIYRAGERHVAAMGKIADIMALKMPLASITINNIEGWDDYAHAGERENLAALLNEITSLAQAADLRLVAEGLGDLSSPPGRESEKWRGLRENAIRQCSEIISFSQSSAARLTRLSPRAREKILLKNRPDEKIIPLCAKKIIPPEMV